MSEMKMNAEESVIERLTRERDEFSLASSKNLERAHDAEEKRDELKTELRRWIDKDIEADRVRDELVRALEKCDEMFAGKSGETTFTLDQLHENYEPVRMIIERHRGVTVVSRSSSQDDTTSEAK